jgi:hypothetical protein
MAATTLIEPLPVRDPVSSPSRLAPAVDPPAVFRPSAELGEQLQHLEKAQAEIDRRRAEELARLRAIQDRD